MGLAVACMHYTAMAAAYFVRDNRSSSAAAHAAESAHISPSILAASVLVFTSLLIVVTIVATYVGKRRLFTFERSYRLITMLIVGWSVIAWLGASYFQQRMSDELYQHELQVAQVQADNVASSIEESTARLRGFALMLARDAGIRSIALQGAADQESNERLAQTARALKVDSMFVLDARGTCIATSKLSEADFYVGRNFANRDYFPDTVDIRWAPGRGSPTGLTCYRHTAFPERYHDGVFALEWTFGKVYFLPRDGKKGEIFLEPTGTE